MTLFLQLMIAMYRRGISPFIPRSCRYLPTCSAYAEESIRRHGPWRGMIFTLQRLARCHPWGSHGYDPVPETPRAVYKQSIPDMMIEGK